MTRHVTRSRVPFPGQAAVGFGCVEDGGVSRPFLGENVKPSVPVVINNYDNRYWAFSALKSKTDNFFFYVYSGFHPTVVCGWATGASESN